MDLSPQTEAQVVAAQQRLERAVVTSEAELQEECWDRWFARIARSDCGVPVSRRRRPAVRIRADAYMTGLLGHPTGGALGQVRMIEPSANLDLA
jgi:hypothetical protein